MNADPAVQRRLLELADADAALNRIRHRRASLPEQGGLDRAEAAVRSRRDALVAVETALSDLDREIRRLERDVDAVRSREDRDRNLLTAGEVSAKQLTDVQHELATLQRRQGVLEDELLEVMERREATGAEAERSRGALAAADEELAAVRKVRDEALSDLDVDERRRTDDRTALLRELPTELVELYERIRARSGTGAAPLSARRCGACRLELDRTALGRIRVAAPDEVVRCEECATILVRTAESGL